MTTWRIDRPYRWPWLRWAFLLWWRLRERDVTDARYPEAETKGPPDYTYGKVTGLAPDLRVITEVTESPYVCCGYCSAGMAVWTARKGTTHSMGGAAHPIRADGGRPHDNGSKASELRNGASRAFNVKLDALAVAEIPDVLRDGFAVVVNLDYAQLPGFLRVQGGSFGHSCCLYGWKPNPDGGSDLCGFFDPLWPEGAAGAWAPWSQVNDALWADGEHSGTVVSWAATPAPSPEPPAPPTLPEPCPDCPPPEVTRADLDAAVAEAVESTRLWRDRAWRSASGFAQPRYDSPWGPTAPGAARAASWSWFARWGPSVDPMTWNGPGATWGDADAAYGDTTWS